MEYKRSEFARMASVDISSNGFRILRTPRYQKIIMKTIIRDFGNGQGAMEWLDAKGDLVCYHCGTLEEDYYPRLGEVVIQKKERQPQK